MKNVNKRSEGFTIIEVVLVLAIAGLIFLIVFLAVPALQRSQRDTQRRNDVGRVISGVQSNRTNDRGQLPSDWDGDFKDQYLLADGGDVFDDPQHGPYTLSTTVGASATPGDGVIAIHEGSICDGGSAVTGGDRQVAVRVTLEGGGVYCASN